MNDKTDDREIDYDIAQETQQKIDSILYKLCVEERVSNKVMSMIIDLVELNIKLKQWETK